MNEQIDKKISEEKNIKFRISANSTHARKKKVSPKMLEDSTRPFHAGGLSRKIIAGSLHHSNKLASHMELIEKK